MDATISQELGNWSLGVVHLVPFSVLDYVRMRIMQYFLPDNNLFEHFPFNNVPVNCFECVRDFISS